MEKRSPYALLERSLRRLVRMRELGAPASVLEQEIALAMRWWSQVPPAPAGAELVWSEDIAGAARELGFTSDTRPRPALDDETAAHLASARALYALVALIDREVTAAGRVTEVHVVAVGAEIRILGFADDADARARAETVARRIAPNVTIVNQVRLR